MASPPQSLTTLLARLAASGTTDFLLVGGLAAVAQGAPLTTLDVDVVHRRGADNVERLLAFLASVDARYRGRPAGQAGSPRKAVALTAGKTRAQVGADEIGQLALARLLEIVGEAAGKVSPGYEAAHPELPRSEMCGLRNRLAHAYFEVDLEVLLDIVANDLPPLIGLLERRLAGNG